MDLAGKETGCGTGRRKEETSDVSLRLEGSSVISTLEVDRA